MGAVIWMAGLRAQRNEIFDIGIAGPLAGLVVAVQVMWIGIQRLDLTEPAHGLFALDMPLLVRWALDHASPQGGHLGDGVWHSQWNPYVMAGWVGLPVPGLNMLPVIQLDGSVILASATGELLHREASVAPTITLPETLILTAPPVGYGACAVGHEIVFANGTRIVSPDNEAVVALAGAGPGYLYAATRRAVHVIAYNPADSRGTPFPLASVEVKEGRVVTGGLAVGPNRLYVTTTAGVLVYGE